MNHDTGPIDKKDFGVNIYKFLYETYGNKDYYEVTEIQDAVQALDYPISWECWALVAFMLPANAGEYFRSKGTPMNIVEMKKEFIETMSDGKQNRVTQSSRIRAEYDIEPSEIIKSLTHRSLTNYFAARIGYSLGGDFW